MKIVPEEFVPPETSVYHQLGNKEDFEKLMKIMKDKLQEEDIQL